jgi:hypothetical protein
MKSRISSSLILFGLILTASVCTGACRKEKSAADTIRPVADFFETQTGQNLISPDISSIEGTQGMILTWKIESDTADYVEYSWVLAKNTDALMKALIVFDSARAWNTESYIFLPISLPAVEVHRSVGLSVPQAIYDEDGMNRIRELVLSGEAPEGSFIDQFDRFMEE